MKFTKLAASVAGLLTATRGVEARTDQSLGAWQNPTAFDGGYGTADVSYVSGKYTEQVSNYYKGQTGYGDTAYTAKLQPAASGYGLDTGWTNAWPPRTDGTATAYKVSSRSSEGSFTSTPVSSVSDESIGNDKGQRTQASSSRTQSIFKQPPSYSALRTSTLKGRDTSHSNTVRAAVPNETSLPYSNWVANLTPTSARLYGSLADSRPIAVPTYLQSGKSHSASTCKNTYVPRLAQVEMYKQIHFPWEDHFAGNHGILSNEKFDFESPLSLDTPRPSQATASFEEEPPMMGATAFGPLAEYYTDPTFVTISH